MYKNIYITILKYTYIHKLKTKNRDEYIFDINFLIGKKSLYVIEKNINFTNWYTFIYNKEGLYIFEKYPNNMNDYFWSIINHHSMNDDRFLSFMKKNHKSFNNLYLDKIHASRYNILLDTYSKLLDEKTMNKILKNAYYFIEMCVYCYRYNNNQSSDFNNIYMSFKQKNRHFKKYPRCIF
jgi:hypothetical protein